MFSKASKWTFAVVLYPWFRFNAGFVPQQDCVVYLFGIGVIEMLPRSLSFGIASDSHSDSPILSSDSGYFGLQVLSCWSFLKCLGRGLLATVTLWLLQLVPKASRSKRVILIFSSRFLVGQLTEHIWIHFTVLHICIKKETLPCSYFVRFCKLTTITYRHWNGYFPRGGIAFYEWAVFFFSYAHYSPFTRLYSLTKPQHASLEFIVDVVLLLWVATKIVMSCPHLTVTEALGHLCVGGCVTKNTMSLWFKWLYILHQKYRCEDLRTWWGWSFTLLEKCSRIKDLFMKCFWK